MSKGSAKPPVPGKSMTVVFDESAAKAVGKLMRRAKKEDPDNSSRNAVINRAVESAAEIVEESL